MSEETPSKLDIADVISKIFIGALTLTLGILSYFQNSQVEKQNQIIQTQQNFLQEYNKDRDYLLDLFDRSVEMANANDEESLRAVFAIVMEEKESARRKILRNYILARLSDPELKLEVATILEIERSDAAIENVSRLPASGNPETRIMSGTEVLSTARSGVRIDIFYCLTPTALDVQSKNLAAAEIMAQELADLSNEGAVIGTRNQKVGSVRLRALTPSKNAERGYRITQWEIRADNRTGEIEFAEAVRMLASERLQQESLFVRGKNSSKTDDYISLFYCSV